MLKTPNIEVVGIDPGYAVKISYIPRRSTRHRGRRGALCPLWCTSAPSSVCTIDATVEGAPSEGCTASALLAPRCTASALLASALLASALLAPTEGRGARKLTLLSPINGSVL